MMTRSERQRELQSLFDIGGRSAGIVVERFVEVCPQGRTRIGCHMIEVILDFEEAQGIILPDEPQCRFLAIPPRDAAGAGEEALNVCDSRAHQAAESAQPASAACPAT